jgi:hypothetical protein
MVNETFPAVSRETAGFRGFDVSRETARLQLPLLATAILS